MRRNHKIHFLIGIMAMSLTASAIAAPVSTAFTYQGQLKNTGSPVNGNTNMAFSLWDAASGGAQQSATLTFDGAGGNPAPISVSSGLFTVQLDFGVDPYTANAARWLEVSVNGTTLTPRQPLTPTPFSVNTRGLAVDSSSQVGIGTTSPTAKLQVDSNTHPAAVISSSDSSGAWLTLDDTLGGGAGWTLISSGGLNGEGPGNLMFLDVNDQSIRMLINGAGNVGIGTSTPSQKLSVGGIIQSTTGGFKFPDSTVQTSAASAFTAGSGLSLSSGILSVASDGVNSAMLASDAASLSKVSGATMASSGGNIGIGTQNPISALDVRGSGGVLTDNAFGFSAPSSGPVPSDTYINSPGGGRIAFTTTSVERMRIDDNGKVGIGTTTPSEALEVRAAGTATAIRFGGPFGTGSLFAGSGGVGINVGDGTTGLSIDQTTKSVSVGARLGVGTTTPAEKLEVRGNIKLGDSGQYFAASGEQNLRIVSGNVAANGTTPSTDFTVNHSSTGIYTITYVTPFTGVLNPAVTVTAFNGAAPRIVTLTAFNNNSFNISIWTAGGTLVDSLFSFSSIGPR